MRVWVAFLFPFVFQGICYAQFPNSPNLLDENGKPTGHWTVLYDSNYHEVKDPDSVVYYRLIRFEAGVPAGKVRDFYKNGHKSWDGFLKSVDPHVFDGESNSYYENGKLNARQFYINGNREGAYTSYHLNGVVSATGQFKSDTSVGRWSYYHDNGAMEIDIAYDSGMWNGPVTFFHANGKVKATGYYYNNESDSVWIHYSEEGLRESLTTYKEGLQHGVYETYFPDGSIETCEMYEFDGKVGPAVSYREPGKLEYKGEYSYENKSGWWTYYFPNGQIESQGLMDREAQGKWEFFHENGKLKLTGEMRDGLHEGEWKSYYDDGSLSYVAVYELDSLNGPRVDYFQGGGVSSEGMMVDGEAEGHWKYYHENAKLKMEGDYKFDEEEGIWISYYETGEVEQRNSYSFGSFEGLCRTYFKTGQLESISLFRNNERDSLYVKYFPNGGINGTGVHVSGLRTGVWRWYYEGGNLENFYTYENDLENGPFTTYYPNGNRKSEGIRMNGQPHGEVTFYFENGKLEQRGAFVYGDPHGKWLAYDSVTGRKTTETAFEHGKYHGKVLEFDGRGKVKGTRYFYRGNEETVDLAYDSVFHALAMKDYARALLAVKWLERLAKRDYPEGSTTRDLAYSLYGRVYSSTGLYNKAYEWHKKYLDQISTKETPAEFRRVAIHNVANSLHGDGRYAEALVYFDLAVQVAKTGGINDNYWSSVTSKAICLFDADRREEADALFDESMRTANELFGPDSSATWYLRKEITNYYADRVKDYDKALTYGQELLGDIIAAGKLDHEFVYECARKVGDLFYEEQGKTDEAVGPYTQAMQYAERNNQTDQPSYLEILANLSFIMRTRDPLDTAAASARSSYAKKLTALVDLSVDGEMSGEGNLALGNYYYDLSDYRQALPFYQHAYDGFDRASMGNSFRQGAVLQSMAFCLYYGDKLQYKTARKYFEQSMNIRLDQGGETSSTYYDGLAQFGGFLSLINEYDTSIVVLKRARELAEQQGGAATVAICNLNLGEAYYYTWRYEAAINFFKLAESFYGSNVSHYPYHYVNSISFISNCYKNRDEFENARKYAELAIRIAESNFGSDDVTYYNKLALLGEVYERNDLYSEAIKRYEQAAGGLAELFGKESVEYLMQINAVIKAYSEMTDYKKAVELGDPQVELIRRHLGDSSVAFLELLPPLANAHSNLKHLAIAERYLVKAIAVSEAVNGDPSAITATHVIQLGEFYYKRNRIEEAEEVYQQALDMMLATGYRNTSVIGAYYANLGKVKSERDKNKEAELLFRRGFEVTRGDSANNINSYVKAGSELAQFWTKMGRYRDAEKLIKRITPLIEKHYGRKYYYASERENLVWIYYRQSMYAEAEREAMELIAIVEEDAGTEHWRLRNLHNYLGMIADSQSKFQKAKEEYTYCLNAQLREKSPTEVQVASLAVFYNNIADVEMELGDFKKGLSHLDEAARLRKQVNDHQTLPSRIGTLSTYAACYEAAGELQKAEALWVEISKSLIDFSHENFYFMSDEEKAQFWTTITGSFRRVYAFGTTRYKTNPMFAAEMYNVQLATKAALLNASNKIRKRILSSGDTAMVNMFYRWTHLKEQLAQLYTDRDMPSKKKQIDSLLLVATALERDMNITAEDISKDKGGERVSWKNVQAALGPGEAAIEILRFKKFERYTRDTVIYAALVVTSETKQHPELVMLPDGNFLEERALKFYRNAIATKIRDTLSYRNYWAPLEPILRGKERIYLSLDGVYNQLNLNTLLTPSGKHLVDEKNLTILSNTKDVIAIKSRRARKLSFSSAMLFGFPTYFVGKKGTTENAAGTRREVDMSTLSETDETGIAPLFGTQEEINKVEAILGSHKMVTNTFMRELATESQIKKIQHPRVLHIATHGFFTDAADNESDKDNPLLRSGLLLTGASNFLQSHRRLDEENGILTAYEASNLDLENTDLVVLSACETGKGEVQNGEGVYGLQRAFQTAGAQTIIMSLWKVDDTATQLLMTAFYSNWMGGMTKPEALKEAQVALKRQYPHPYYWGAFVMLEN